MERSSIPWAPRLLLLAAWALTLPAVARAQEAPVVRVEGTTLRLTGPEGTRVVEIGCVAVETLLVEGRIYAACGGAGVVRVDLASNHVGRRQFEQPVVGLSEIEGVLWARLSNGQLRRVVGTEPAPPAPQTVPAPVEDIVPAPPAAVVPAPAPAVSVPPQVPERAQAAVGRRPPPAPVGRVARVASGYAIVTLEPGSRLSEGGSVEFVTRPARTEIQLESERDDLVSVGRGVVEAVSAREARVRIEVNAPVRPQMRVRPSDGGDLLLLPPEPVGVATLSLRLRPFIPMGILGFGAINDLSIGYTTDFGLAIRAVATGFAFGIAQRRDPSEEHLPFMPVVHGYVGAVTRWFEIGLGLGWSRSYRVRAVDAERSEGFSALAMLRVGTEDGLSARVRFTLLVREVWEVGDLYLDGRVPVAHGVWVIVGGGGGNTGVRYGEAGVRLLVEGNGRGGSVFLHGTLGVGMIEQGGNFSNAGPMVGLGLDIRL